MLKEVFELRKIKFRGKRVDSGEWVTGYYFKTPLSDEATGLNKIEDGLYFCISRDNVVYEVDPETIGQYTGLHDCNGKEICEGAILKAVSLENDHHQKGSVIVSSVEYFCGNACLSITYVPIYPFIVGHKIEVIGNISDNPELLKYK